MANCASVTSLTDGEGAYLNRGYQEACGSSAYWSSLVMEELGVEGPVDMMVQLVTCTPSRLS